MTELRAVSQPLRIAQFLSLNLPVNDLAVARTFYAGILGAAEQRTRSKNVLKFRFADFGILVGLQSEMMRRVDAEYPHCAFTVTSDQFLSIKQRLDSYGVPTNDPWSRAGKAYALMYFRDPFGNQFELFSPYGCDGLPLRIGARAGGDYVTDFTALAYRELRSPNFVLPDFFAPGLNHLTVPVRDLAEAKSFLVSVLGGRVVHDRPAHVTCVIGGVDFGVAPDAELKRADELSYPNYCFRAEGDIGSLAEQLAALGMRSEVTSEPDREERCLSFRDPSGNLFRLIV